MPAITRNTKIRVANVTRKAKRYGTIACILLNFLAAGGTVGVAYAFGAGYIVPASAAAHGINMDNPVAVANLMQQTLAVSQHANAPAKHQVKVASIAPKTDPAPPKPGRNPFHSGEVQ